MTKIDDIISKLNAFCVNAHDDEVSIALVVLSGEKAFIEITPGDKSRLKKWLIKAIEVL